MSLENMGDSGLQPPFPQHPHSSSLHPHALMPQNHNHMPPFSIASNIGIPTNSEQNIPESSTQYIGNDTDLNQVPLHNQDVQMVSSPHPHSPLEQREQQQQQHHQQQQQQQQPSSQLQIHEPTSTLSTDRNHMCPTCNKGFKSKQQLAQHSLVHSGIRKHVCSFCDKGFKQLCHLQQHIRIHTGEKPYKCTFEGCERAFAQMANLHHHMRNHDDHVRKAASKQFHCMVCHRAYTNESSLKNHTLKMHVNIKPLEPSHHELLYKSAKQQKEATQNYNSPQTIDLTKDADDIKPPETSSGYSHEHRDKLSVPISYLNEPRPTSFVRYMDEHLRLSQSLANEPPGIHVSSPMSVLSHPILTDLHRQSVRESSSHVQHSSHVREQNSREQSSETASSPKEIHLSAHQRSDSHISQHKDSHVPSVNIAHYNSPPMQFGGLPMRMSLPSRLQSFSNLPVTVSNSKESQGRVISPENPFPRLMAPVVSVNLSGSASSPQHSQRMSMNI